MAAVTETLTGAITVRLAEADLAGSATLLAVTVTVCWAATLAGAVYRPAASMVPRLGLSDQVTDGLPGPPLTAALNNWVLEA